MFLWCRNLGFYIFLLWLMNMSAIFGHLFSSNNFLCFKAFFSAKKTCSHVINFDS